MGSAVPILQIALAALISGAESWTAAPVVSAAGGESFRVRYVADHGAPGPAVVRQVFATRAQADRFAADWMGEEPPRAARAGEVA